MKAYHETEHGTIYQGNSIDVLRTLDTESIDCCITSPPYWGLRDYGCDGHLGLEPTPELYVEHMVELFREVKRVLKKNGTLWLNLGDSYNGSRKGSGGTGKLSAKQNTNIGANFAVGGKSIKTDVTGLKPKDLVGIPWRVAFALQADGWWLRQDIIWHKPNPMPESVTDRCTKAHEYIFLLTKSAKYYFDNEAIKERTSPKAIGSWQQDTRNTHKMGNGNTGINAAKEKQKAEMKEKGYIMRNKRSVWTVNTRPYKGAHFATYPPELIRPMVKTTRPNAAILDPFFGSGTTGLVAVQEGRKYIGIDLNAKYIDMAIDRISTYIGDVFN